MTHNEDDSSEDLLQIRAEDVIVIHTVVTGGPDTIGWVHTHGLDQFGLPELEIRNLPVFMSAPAGHLLNRLANYMLNAPKKVKLHDTLQVTSNGISITLVKSKPIPGQESHYETERWQVVDANVNSCLCGMCAERN